MSRLHDTCRGLEASRACGLNRGGEGHRGAAGLNVGSVPVKFKTHKMQSWRPPSAPHTGVIVDRSHVAMARGSRSVSKRS